MAMTLRSTDILFNDGTTQSTAAQNSSATASYGSVGSYVFATHTTFPAGTSPGSTVAGSSLYPAGVRAAGNWAATDTTNTYEAGSETGLVANITSTLAGTWRAMGAGDSAAALSANGRGSTLFLRIS